MLSLKVIELKLPERLLGLGGPGRATSEAALGTTLQASRGKLPGWVAPVVSSQVQAPLDRDGQKAKGQKAKRWRFSRTR